LPRPYHQNALSDYKYEPAGWWMTCPSCWNVHANRPRRPLMTVIHMPGIRVQPGPPREGQTAQKNRAAITNAGGAVRYCPLCHAPPFRVTTHLWPLPLDLTPLYYPFRLDLVR